jgi:predicted nucleic acid-binding protein
MGLAVVDASVLIAAVDKQDAHHERAIAELESALDQQRLRVPAVALSEALVGPYRRGLSYGRAVERGLRRLGRVEPVTADIASRAAQLRTGRRIKLPDALILATAVELRAQDILTFDERWQSVDPRVRLLTSFPAAEAPTAS